VTVSAFVPGHTFPIVVLRRILSRSFPWRG